MKAFADYIRVSGAIAPRLAAVSTPFNTKLQTGEPAVFRRYNVLDGFTLFESVISFGDFDDAAPDKAPPIVRHLPTNRYFVLLHWANPRMWDDPGTLHHYLKTHPDAHMTAGAISQPLAETRPADSLTEEVKKKKWWNF